MWNYRNMLLHSMQKRSSSETNRSRRQATRDLEHFHNRFHKRRDVAIFFGTIDRIIARHRAWYLNGNAARSKATNVERWKLRLERLNRGEARLDGETLPLRRGWKHSESGFGGVWFRKGRWNVETSELRHSQRSPALEFPTVPSS